MKPNDFRASRITGYPKAHKDDIPLHLYIALLRPTPQGTSILSYIYHNDPHGKHGIYSSKYGYFRQTKVLGVTSLCGI